MDLGPDLLTDAEALRAADHVGLVAAVATAGAQVRSVADQFASVTFERPRALVVIDGDEAGDAELAGALLPSARVPVSRHTELPTWVGALDLVVVLAASPDDVGAARAAAEADRRGAQLAVRSAEHGAVAVAAGASLLPPRVAVPELTAGAGRLAFLLAVAAAADIAPGVQDLRWDHLAEALDTEALACGPSVEPFVNPALALALHLTGGPGLLVAGDPIGLAVARRGARALRLLGGHPAAAQPAAGLVTGGQLIARMGAPADLFADPDLDGQDAARPVGVLVPPPAGRDERAAAGIAALARGLPRAVVLAPDGPVDPGLTGAAAAAATLVLRIEFAAAYLGIAAGQVPPADGPDGLGPSGGARIVRPATTVEGVTSDDQDNSGDRPWS